MINFLDETTKGGNSYTSGKKPSEKTAIISQRRPLPKTKLSTLNRHLLHMYYNMKVIVMKWSSDNLTRDLSHPKLKLHLLAC